MRDNTQMERVQAFDDVVDYSVAEVDVRIKERSESGRRFTMTQLTWAVVATHLATLALCLLVAAVLCLRSRSADDVDRSDDDDFDARHVRHLHSTGSNLTTGSDVKKMADMTTETVYLRLNGMHPYRCTGNYLCDTSTTAVSLTR